MGRPTCPHQQCQPGMVGGGREGGEGAAPTSARCRAVLSPDLGPLPRCLVARCCVVSSPSSASARCHTVSSLSPEQEMERPERKRRQRESSS
jgi:hypothetical protein